MLRWSPDDRPPPRLSHPVACDCLPRGSHAVTAANAAARARRSLSRLTLEAHGNCCYQNVIRHRLYQHRRVRGNVLRVVRVASNVADRRIRPKWNDVVLEGQGVVGTQGRIDRLHWFHRHRAVRFNHLHIRRTRPDDVRQGGLTDCVILVAWRGPLAPLIPSFCQTALRHSSRPAALWSGRCLFNGESRSGAGSKLLWDDLIRGRKRPLHYRRFCLLRRTSSTPTFLRDQPTFHLLSIST
jgi:hypothetical protein